jgi:hypothetical protein
MHLTACFKLRANNHDATRLRVALGRWHEAYRTALDRLQSRQVEVRRVGITTRTGRDGAERYVVDGAAVHALVLAHVPNPVAGLHSSCRMSMVVAVEEQLKSYLGLLCEWLNGGKKSPRPSFPSVAPGSARAAAHRWEQALAASAEVTDLPAEEAWRAEVTRAARGKTLPLAFGAATSGIEGQAHLGLLRRDDGRLFALLTLFPQGDPLGEPVTRARNRRDRGTVINIADSPARAQAQHERACRKAEKAGQPRPEAPAWTPTPFAPTERARASLLVPLECGQGHQALFLRRAVPKSGELLERDGEFYLHVAFEFPEVAPRPLRGNVLAVKRGIATLVAWVVLSPAGQELARGTLCGKALAQLVTEQGRVRAVRQAKGKLTRGDRRVSRVVEHHLYSAAHQLVDLACQHGAELVLLNDRQGRKPQRWLAYKHWSQLHEILQQLCAEAGLPEPREREIYGSWQVCTTCGYAPGDPVRHEDVGEDGCPGCRARRDPEFHLARLLGWDTLRFREFREGGTRPRLGEYLRGKR